MQDPETGNHVHLFLRGHICDVAEHAMTTLYAHQGWFVDSVVMASEIELVGEEITNVGVFNGPS